MKHLDLFSGIGGFALATEMVWPNVEHIFCDNDLFCQKVLKKHWPQSKIYGDIKQLNGRDVGTVDLVTGGFPCQPFSSAGKQKGKEDDRDLWPEMFRLIKETNPHWIVGENVVGFIAMELERSLSDLESEGYEVQTFVIPACAVNAPHRRDRVWIVAHADHTRDKRTARKHEGASRTKRLQKRNKVQLPYKSTNLHATNAAGNHEQRSIPKSQSRLQPLGTDPFFGAWEARKSLLPSTVLCRTDDGIPHRVDRTRALGNAIVPQVAAEIFKAIKEIDSGFYSRL